MRRYQTSIFIITGLLIVCVSCCVASVMPTRSNMPMQGDRLYMVSAIGDQTGLITLRGVQNAGNCYCEELLKAGFLSLINTSISMFGVNGGRCPISTKAISQKNNIPVRACAVPFPITFILRNLGSNLRRKLRKRRLI